MQILVKFTEHQRSTNVITQEIIDSELVIEQDLQTFGIADFTMPIIDGIEEDTRVDIYEVNNTDTRIFSGFVYKIEPIWNSFSLMKVQCRSEKAILQKRYTTTPIRMFKAEKGNGIPTVIDIGNVGKMYRKTGKKYLSEITGVYYSEGGGEGYTTKSYPLKNTSYIIDTLTNDIRKYDGAVFTNIGNNANGLDIKILLEAILDDFTQFGESRSVETDFNSDLYMDINQGDNVYNLIDELAVQCQTNRDIVDGQLIFKQNIGQDYSTGSEYQEIIYNSLFPNTANIQDISVVGTATQSNVVMVKNKRGYITLNTSQYTAPLKGISMYEIRDGDESDKLTQYLSKVNQKQRTYKVTTEQNSIIANVGDKIKLVVENTNSFFDIDSAVTVIKKTITYTNASKFTSYEVGEIVVIPINIQNLLYSMKKDIQLLKV